MQPPPRVAAQFKWAVAMAQLVNFFRYKHWELSLIPRTHVNTGYSSMYPYNPNPEEADRRIPRVHRPAIPAK